MRYCFIFIAFVSLLCSCKGTQPVDDADVLVKVKDRTLRRSEIKQQIPRGLSSADSMLLAESLERKWVKDALVTMWPCATWREKIRRKWISWWRNIVIR